MRTECVASLPLLPTTLLLAFHSRQFLFILSRLRRNHLEAFSDLACFLRQGRDEAPLLVETVVVGPLDHIRPATFRSIEDVKYQAAIAVLNLIEGAVNNQAPLLVQPVVVGPLDDMRPRICRTTKDIKYQSAIAVHNLIVGAVRNEGPLLIGAAVVGPLNHLRARVCATTRDVHDQATIAIHNLIVCLASVDGSVGGEGTATNRVAPLLLHNIRILVPEHVRALQVAR